MPKEKINEKYSYEYERCLKISELIKELQAIKKEHGDLPVGHITNGLTMYISQKYRPVGCDGNDIFPTIRISNLRYWKKTRRRSQLLIIMTGLYLRKGKKN